MASNLQIPLQRPHPLHMVASMEMVPSAFLVSAGQPGFKHMPHFLHFSGTGTHLVVNLLPFKSTQGDFVIITDTFTKMKIMFLQKDMNTKKMENIGQFQMWDFAREEIQVASAHKV